MGKQGVDGVYSADPKVDPKAELLPEDIGRPAMVEKVAEGVRRAMEVFARGPEPSRVEPGAQGVDVVQGEQHLERGGDRWVVVDDQDGRHRISLPSRAPSRHALRVAMAVGVIWASWCRGGNIYSL